MIKWNHRKAPTVSKYLLCPTTTCHYHFPVHDTLSSLIKKDKLIKKRQKKTATWSVLSFHRVLHMKEDLRLSEGPRPIPEEWR